MWELELVSGHHLVGVVRVCVYMYLCDNVYASVKDAL